MSRRSLILLFALAILALGAEFWLLHWLADPAQAETIGMGIQEGMFRRALRERGADCETRSLPKANYDKRPLCYVMLRDWEEFFLLMRRVE